MCSAWSDIGSMLLRVHELRVSCQRETPYLPSCLPVRLTALHSELSDGITSEWRSAVLLFFFSFPLTMKCHRLHSPSLPLPQQLSAESTQPPASRERERKWKRDGEYERTLRKGRHRAKKEKITWYKHKKWKMEQEREDVEKQRGERNYGKAKGWNTEYTVCGYVRMWGRDTHRALRS